MLRSAKRTATVSQWRSYAAKVQTHRARADLQRSPTTSGHKLRVQLSPSQAKVVDLSRTRNVIVKGGPGSGKTATALGIIAASHCPKTLMLTFSSRLQTVAEDGHTWRLPRPSTVITYQSLLGKLFGSRPGLEDNRRLEKLMREGQPDYPEYSGFWAYDTVILDEFQNCTPQIYFLVRVALLVIQEVSNATPKLVVLGDKNQALEGPSGADPRFFTMARDMFLSDHQGSDATGTHDFAEETLVDGGFRCTPEMAQFVNKVYGLGSKKLQVPARRVPGEKPTFLYANFKSETQLEHLVRLIRKYGPGNTAILALEVIDNPTVARLASVLSCHFGLPVAHPLGDERPLVYALTCKKICVATFGQYKGEEHDLVIICGIDPTPWEDGAMPASVYTALTRARNHLVVLHDAGTMAPLPKPMWRPLMLHANLRRGRHVPEPPEHASGSLVSARKESTLTIGDITQLIPEHDLMKLVDDHLEITIRDLIPDGLGSVASKKAILNPDDGSQESTGDLDKFVMVAAYEHHMQGTLRTLGVDPEHHQARMASFPKSWCAKQAAWMCRHACLNDATRTGWYVRHNAIEKIPDSRLGWWMEHDVLSRAVRRLGYRFGRPGHVSLGFGVRVAGEDMFDGTANVLRGYIDIVELKGAAPENPIDITATQGFSTLDGEGLPSSASDNDTGQGSIARRIIEVKSVEELTTDHAIGAIIKSYLWSHDHPGEPVPPAVVFNIRDGEEMHIKPRYGVASVKRLMESLRKAHREALNRPPLTDDGFAEMCSRIRTRAQEVAQSMKPISPSKLAGFQEGRIGVPLQTPSSLGEKGAAGSQCPPSIKWGDLAWKTPAKGAR